MWDAQKQTDASPAGQKRWSSTRTTTNTKINSSTCYRNLRTYGTAPVAESMPSNIKSSLLCRMLYIYNSHHTELGAELASLNERKSTKMFQMPVIQSAQQIWQRLSYAIPRKIVLYTSALSTKIKMPPSLGILVRFEGWTKD